LDSPAISDDLAFAKPNALYTMAEVAKHMRVSRRWLQDFIRVNPFYRMAGRKKLFLQSDIEALIAALPRPSAPRIPVRAGQRHAFASRTPSNSLQEALRLASEKTPRKKSVL
jgi:hypothetical protein